MLAIEKKVIVFNLTHSKAIVPHPGGTRKSGSLKVSY
jgi:hypothetical protein